MRRFLIVVAIVLAGALSISALPKIKYVDFRVYDPVYVAIDKGFFERNGIEVELLGLVLGGPTAIQAVAAGQAQAGLGSYMAVINAVAAGLPILAVADVQSAVGKQPLEEYFVRTFSQLHSLGDLATRQGKTKWAVNLWKSSFHYTALMALAKNGIPESKVSFVLLPFPQQITALVAGEVDIIGLIEPYASEMKTLGGARVLFNAFDVFGQKQFTPIFVNRDWARANPAQARAFTTAVAQAEGWIEQNESEAAYIVAKYTKVDRRFIPPYYFQPNGAVIISDAQFWLDWMLSRGDVKGSLKVFDFATNEFNGEIK